MTQPDLVIFDCDGVLVDSEIIAARVEAELLTAAGFPIEPEELAETYAGLTFKDIMLRIEEQSQIPFQASLIDQAESLVDRRLQAEVRAIEGAHEAVASVTGPRCICSNSSSERLNMMLEKTRLLPFFSGRIFSSLETPSKKPKPAPDVFLHAVNTLGANPARTFVVEDSVHGISGAKAAGLRVIGFTGASHSYPGHADALTEAGAETVIRRWADFPGVVAALLEWSEDA
ncbi:MULTISPECIES: HAD family hydrolase [unclassified Mesorhizobium]|uniref:HAD family hydrolase n=1 Tax=unclassified Mesorhizobium TaxID=325217 RepID=UPI0008F2D8A9|nr:MULTISPECIES: HAD family hydrolase [unclassified Mesorhizobium]RJG45976.1 HAD family hydrolase [Mesorhizobium sp. DCY119]SFT95591.1 haloacid dehalogenase superfamily, subfamily IA, variant 3 with third motif having DD or ED [Mesorhizobium sp. YR577]